MAQDLTEQFIDDSRVRFASDMLTEFGFNHPQGRLSIGTLVIVVKERTTMILVVVP